MAGFDPPTFSDRSHYRSYFSSNKLRLLSFLFWQGVLTLFLSCLVWGFSQLSPINIINLSIPLPAPQQALLITAIVSILLLLVWPLVYGYRHWHIGLQNHRISRQYYKQLKGDIIIMFALILYILLIQNWHIFTSSTTPLIPDPLAYLSIVAASVIGISANILIKRSEPFFSKQQAIWRNAWRYARQDRIRSEYSPIEDIVHPINRLSRAIRNFSTIHNPYAILFLSFLIGGLIIPTWQVIGDSERNFHITLSTPFNFSLFLKECIYSIFLIFEKFIPDSITYIGLIFGFFIGLSLFLRRQRYIISPFTTPDQQNQDEKNEPCRMRHSTK